MICFRCMWSNCNRWNVRVTCVCYSSGGFAVWVIGETNRGIASLNDGIWFGPCSFHKQSVFYIILVFIYPSEGCTDIQESLSAANVISNLQLEGYYWLELLSNFARRNCYNNLSSIVFGSKDGISPRIQCSKGLNPLRIQRILYTRRRFLIQRCTSLIDQYSYSFCYTLKCEEDQRASVEEM